MDDAGIGLTMMASGLSGLASVLIGIGWVVVGVVWVRPRSSSAMGLFIGGGLLELVGAAFVPVAYGLTSAAADADSLLTLSGVIQIGSMTIYTIKVALLMGGVLALCRRPGRDPRDPDPRELAGS
ncbi:MAG: hypothetical protein AAGF12_37735 [Myxococcota bacterium]